MKTYVGQLIFEVTRKCNMHCAHCLRGDVQGLDMAEEIMDRVLDSVDSLCDVLFTGGEPTLNLPLMEHFLDELDRRETCMEAFEVVTNGKEHQLDLAMWCIRAFQKCAEPEMCYLAMSKDVYHDPVDGNLFKAFSFYHKRRKTPSFRRKTKTKINNSICI